MNSKKIVISVIAVLLLLGISAGVFVALDGESENQSKTQESSDTSTTPRQDDVIDESDADDLDIEEIEQTTSMKVMELAQDLESCGYTESATAGPYYVSGTRFLDNGNLNYRQQSGDPIVIGGYVYGSADKSTPLGGASIEIWHADDDGEYYPETSGDATDFDQDRIQLRGYVKTDENGYYEFSSIYPGQYSGRTRHIHIRASTDDGKELFTQIIMTIPNDNTSIAADNIASSLNLDCAQPTMQNMDETQYGAFNIYLQ